MPKEHLDTEMASQAHDVSYLTAIHWQDNQPRVRVQTDETPSTEIVETQDLHLRFRINDDIPRRCVGRIERSTEGSVYVDCESPPTTGRRCERCQIVDNIAAANMHQAHRKGRDAIDQRMAAYLEHPHRLYVAIFRDGSTKIGTTRGTSGGQRLVEQGAWFAKYVGHVEDGFLVRELEDLVSESLNLGQAVDTRKKISGHLRAKDDNELQKILEGVTLEVRKVLKAQNVEGYSLLNETWSNPAIEDPLWQDLVAYPATLTHGAHEFTIRSMVGRLAACTRTGMTEVFLLDLQTLLGRPLERGDFELDELALQVSLF